MKNVPVGSVVEHGENLTMNCSDLYEAAHGLATFSCNNGTWNVIPRCEPGLNVMSLLLCRGIIVINHSIETVNQVNQFKYKIQESIVVRIDEFHSCN